MREKLTIRDKIGRDFKLVSDAVVYPKYLAADLRCLEPDIRPQLSIQVTSSGGREHASRNDGRNCEPDAFSKPPPANEPDFHKVSE